ncbi:uncharacterized protein Z518_01028 [Rhinocladiella mackenziei CBS 650.93]|uniref:Rhinocladiella mackenziei CBS 650.93 unplaced genomic scaffold supercont1.1, whole genome shotgun sequence n=1 Tax=Rhinocladiella mackenziei CBS 650.93 TaxID=1442369 RepID=A0A0D2G595_9EURO|nr:uncharacterized protein Z518_01028 [Rhinocladiella mackenziei CBS 650.93]KIX09947.1 hypothetical protein Z518_01028 [Rhinocladiella mackenziei CBS 650.93]
MASFKVTGGKKRKADTQGDQRPSKKQQGSEVKVTHLTSPDVVKPVVAISPGVTLPENVKFNAFSKKGPAGMSNLLLQSSDHPTIDYVATESNTTDAGEKHIKHYIAIFDEAAKILKVMEAKKMTIRSTVRQPEKSTNSDVEDALVKPPPTPSSRAALTQAFGTKKSKKAIASVAENRLLARSGEDIDTSVSNAILSSIQDDDDDDLLEAIESASSRANKPLPQANLDTSDISEVYPLSSLVFPGPARTTLSQMPLTYWRERASAKKDINSRYRFVAHCVDRLVKRHLQDPKNETILLKLQILRYIQLLLEIRTYTTRLPSSRPIPQPEKWPANTTSDVSLSTSFLSKLISRFFPTSIPTTQAKTLLTTTILALTLHIPPPKFKPEDTPTILLAEPSDIALDLALRPGQVNKLFRELGCKIDGLTDAEITKYGWEKAGKARKFVDEEGKEVTLPKPKFAKLKFPVTFPKVSAGRPNRR